MFYVSTENDYLKSRDVFLFPCCLLFFVVLFYLFIFLTMFLSLFNLFGKSPMYFISENIVIKGCA